MVLKMLATRCDPHMARTGTNDDAIGDQSLRTLEQDL
jgi:hypothetical protein